MQVVLVVETEDEGLGKMRMRGVETDRGGPLVLHSLRRGQPFM